MDPLLAAVVGMSADLELHNVLTRIIRSACDLTDALYGALGVLSKRGDLLDFVVEGIDAETRAQIGELPHGRGVLGVLIRDPRPLRLADLAQHPASTGFPPHHPPMRTLLGTPIIIDGELFGNLYLTEKAGGVPFTDRDEEMVAMLASAAGYVISNSRAYWLSERRRQWSDATRRVGEALQGPVTPPEAYSDVVRLLRSVSGARAVGILRILGDGTPRALARDGPEAALIDSAAALVIDRLQPAAAAMHSAEIEVPERNWWIVLLPIACKLAEPLVALALFDTHERIDDAHERQLMSTFADHVALSLDRTRALEEREQLAVLSDRDRIARDLHDLVIQRLFATGMHLQGLRFEAADGMSDQKLEKAIDDIDLTIKEIRGAIFDLHGTAHESLRTEVRELAKEYASVLGATPSVITSGPVDTAVSDVVRLELLAVLREALSNAARHARARRVSVELRATGSTVTLNVSDDGVGIPAGHHESGLANARRRAVELGGEFDVLPAEPHGTRLVWQVPVA